MFVSDTKYQAALGGMKYLQEKCRGLEQDLAYLRYQHFSKKFASQIQEQEVRKALNLQDSVSSPQISLGLWPSTTGEAQRSMQIAIGNVVIDGVSPSMPIVVTWPNGSGAKTMTLRLDPHI